jgi:hypothetical protein
MTTIMCLRQEKHNNNKPWAVEQSGNEGEHSLKYAG